MPAGILKGTTTQRVDRAPVTVSTSVTLSANAPRSRHSVCIMTATPLDDCRKKTLKCINCRPFLLAICALVVVECACVLAELMIDLQGIKFRFENEETEINRFVSYLRERYPDVVMAEDMRTMAAVINLLEKSIVLRSPKDLLDENHCTCICPSSYVSENMETFGTRSKNMLHSDTMSTLDETLTSQDTENVTKLLSLLHFSNVYVQSSMSPHISESVMLYSSFLLSDSKFSESSFANLLPSLPSSTSVLETTELNSDVLSSNEANLTFKSMLESENITYTLKSSDFNITPSGAAYLAESMASTFTRTDNKAAVLHQTVYSSFSDAHDGMTSIVINRLLLGLPQLTVDLVASGLSSDPVRIFPTSVEDDTNISLHTSYSFHAEIPNTKTLTGLQDVSKTQIRKIHGTGLKCITQSSKLAQSLDSLGYPTNLLFTKHDNMMIAFQSQSNTFPYTPLYVTNVLPHAAQILSQYKPLVASKQTGSSSLSAVKDHIHASTTHVPGHSSMQIDFSSTTETYLSRAIRSEQQELIQRSSTAETPVTANSSFWQRPVSLQDIFILEINNVIDSFFLVAEFVPEHNSVNRTKFIQNTLEYSKIYKASKALHFISLSILSVMVLETAVKLFCTGCAFFKRKFEVFDAFIVISSFALDFVFLDSRWYETGKDATTILVLLLPWRVVRIVNSFLMTMKHKHHLQMMNMKRAKKKAELKSAKLQTLLSEIRKDVQLLVALCRSNEIEEKDITACLYGKGRRSVTLSAMSTCTSLMLISTLGKDAVQEDDIYGKVFKEALNEGDSAELDAEILQAEEAAIDAAIELDDQLEARRKSRKYKSKKAKVKRSYTVPRRSASVETPEPDINENSSSIYYINDGFFNTRGSSPRPSDIVMLGKGPDFTKIVGAVAGCSSVDEEDEIQDDSPPGWKQTPAPPVPPRSKYQSMASVRSVPGKGSRSNSMVTFEVTTQVTYL